ncbi:MAG: hypothetical protein C0490_01745 [Marivirga sp.]|nr:hypothetical protein [Marivirga sp.]
MLFRSGLYEGSSGYISFVNTTGATSLRIKKSNSENEVAVDVSRLPAGLYVCVMELDDRVVYKKIIIY